MSKIIIHETQLEKMKICQNDHFVDEHLRSIQNIEGGPIKKIDLNAMPRPLKLFGYFAFSLLMVFGAATVVISFLR